ncbi:MAG: AAA family ATPase [Lachnospiraceae bacterium]|nr:AAA family ATPase [Lachnospiraceae bacterium]
MTILIGISGSGKSTYAHEKWLEDPLNTIIINKDKIRELLFGYTEDNVYKYYSDPKMNKLEGIVTQIENSLITECIKSGKNLIIDATHLKFKYLKRYLKYDDIDITFVFFDTNLNVAIQRDSKRNRKVGEEIIKKQKISYDNLRKITISEIKNLDNLGYSRVSFQYM